jgi:hypothetical protein
MLAQPALVPGPPPPPRSIKSQATMLELLEGAGMGDVAATMALESDATRRLGDVLADAVKVRLWGKGAAHQGPHSCMSD